VFVAGVKPRSTSAQSANSGGRSFPDQSPPGVNGSRRSPPAKETSTSASSVTHAGLASTL
jgi:hypothetical protein